MATSFDTVYDSFLEKITDSDLLALETTTGETLLYGYMIRACAKFQEICEVDLSDRTNTTIAKQFNNDLDDEIIDIITTGMLVEWLKPKYYFNENLQNALSTKDYSTYSPANLLSQIRETYLETKKEFEVMMNKYSYIHGNIENLTT